jgi:hypothetical protein
MAGLASTVHQIPGDMKLKIRIVTIKNINIQFTIIKFIIKWLNVRQDIPLSLLAHEALITISWFKPVVFHSHALRGFFWRVKRRRCCMFQPFQ